MALPFTFTLAQINPVVGDLDGNSEKILEIWRGNNRENNIVIFPELVVSGYPPEDLILKPSFIDAIEQHVDRIIKNTKTLKSAAIIPTPHRHEGKIYNAAHLIHSGEIIATTLKHELPNYGVFDEKRVFAAGPLPQPVAFMGHKIGLMICEDMWFPKVSAHLKKQGAEILIAPHGSPFSIGKYEERLALARARAQENTLPLIFVNQVGGQDELVFDGGSFAVDDNGELCAQLPLFAEAIKDFKFGETSLLTVPPQEEQIYNALTLGVKDYVRKNNFSGVLLGLSGGVDSALVATIAVDALGAENVSAYMLPSRFTSQDSLDDAAALAGNLGVSLEEISIEQPMAGFESALDNPSGLTHENLQSRIRGTILMALSNSSGKMLLSTGNKSEMATGYATLYGDMNGGFNPLKDIYKTGVYALCEWRNAQGKVIPQNILTKAPTAELRADQTDQDSLPAYDMLDDILHGLIEEELSVTDLMTRGHDKDTILKVWKLLDRSEYKRYQAPPGTKISMRAFGRDRRVPMTNGFTKMVQKEN